jgi:hypothetical protein
MSEMLNDVQNIHELCFMSHNWFPQTLDSFIISLYVDVQKQASDYSDTQQLSRNYLQHSAAQCT